MMTYALKTSNLHKTYAGGVAALRGVDLEVREGDFYALLGPNGAGKSTLIGIVCSLINKSAGSVEVFGHDIDREFSQAKSCIGLVPQEFNFNIFEPVVEIVVNQGGYFGIDRQQAFETAEYLLNKLGLWGKRRDMARELSGGMKRRLMIARALIHDPRLLILDEPTAGVDIEIRRSMWEFLTEINATGTTIILTTHYLEEAETLCRRIGIIDHGSLIENTSMRKLLDRLHQETFILYLRDPLNGLPDLAPHEVRLADSRTLEAVVCREDSLNALFSDLNRLGIEVLSMKNKANRLEELFIGLVGDRETRSGPDAVPA